MKTFLILIFTFFNFVVCGQSNKELYFITGHPLTRTDDLFESVLWRYDRDSSALIRHLQLCGSEEQLSNIKMYVELGYFTLMKSNSWRQEQPYDSLLVFNITNMELRRVSVGKPDCGITATDNNFLLKLPDLLLVAIDFIQRKPIRQLLYNSYEINNLKYSDSVDLQLYKNIYLTGFMGGNIVGSDYILSYSREEDGYLEIIVTGDRSKRPCFPYELPEQFRFNSSSRHTVSINNDDIFLVNGRKETKKDSLGTRQVVIFDKKKEEWSELILSGNLSRIRGFSDWLCGYIGDDNKSLLNKPLPGSSLWQDRATGLSPAIRYERMYAPGILYFYNPSTGVYFELETKQADSEVVLIQDEKVIYRIYDELYEAKLVNGKKLASVKLLLKDDRVPDIHWAFYR
ncbi:hypothetical protein [Culturomica massiliensis]|uniref:hypothetical protein n=1 Tax=Culturomica massiliensis TaxID=1841857 RepID=UPI000838AC89|nr:hypothetical protein [Culturomica massiliensis]